MGTHPVSRERTHRMGGSISSFRHDLRRAPARGGRRRRDQREGLRGCACDRRGPRPWRHRLRAAQQQSQHGLAGSECLSLHLAGPGIFSDRSWMSGPGIADRLAAGSAAFCVSGTNLLRSLCLALGRQPIRSGLHCPALGPRESGQSIRGLVVPGVAGAVVDRRLVRVVLLWARTAVSPHQESIHAGAKSRGLSGVPTRAPLDLQFSR